MSFDLFHNAFSFKGSLNGITVKFIVFDILFPFLFCIFFIVFGLFLILLGLYHVRSTIDLQTRQVTITRRNWAFYKRKATETFPLESIKINALFFPDLGNSSSDTWMVRTGCGDYVILAKEFYSVRERNAAMLAIWRKIFPEYSHIDESVIVEDGNKAYFSFLESPNEEEHKEQAKAPAGSKFDKLL